MKFSNLTHGADRLKSECTLIGDFETLATIMQSSEGECINIAFGRVLSKGKALLKYCTDNNMPFVLFLDAVDSGMSINNIRCVKTVLKVIIDNCRDCNVDPYIITTANSYDMCYMNNLFDSDIFRCLDVYTFSHKVFKTYDSYVEFIMKTGDIVEKRYLEKDRSDDE